MKHLSLTFISIGKGAFMMSTASSNLEKMLGLVEMNGIILDMLKESGKGHF